MTFEREIKNSQEETQTEERENASSPAATEIIEETLNGRRSLSWRTFIAFIALSLAFASSTFAVTGPNSTIGYVVAEYPQSASDASWIANAPLFCIVTLPPIVGSAGDRYGKKWFIVTGGLIAMAGAIISGLATSLEMVIGGQTIVGVGSTGLILGVPAAMEIVAAKHRLAVVSAISFINSMGGAIGGLLVFGACVEHGIGWRWGYRILACFHAMGVVLVALLYNPPPTRLRQQCSFIQLLKSIDFIGIGLLASGSALLTVALVWGGNTYPWGSSHVIPFLVSGPLILILFGLYEWKGRPDGIIHHKFFESPSFIVFMIFGFVDGTLLYGLSLFIPNELRSLYYLNALQNAASFTTFNGCVLAGFLVCGVYTTRTKQFRLPLIIATAFLTLFCGLTARAKPSNLGYFEAMIGMDGFVTGITEVIPIAGIGLVVPHHLIGTSIQVLSTARALGGAIGIAIFSAIYNNKAATFIPLQVTPILVQQNVPSKLYSTIFGILFSAPAALQKVPGLTAGSIEAILQASATGSAQAYQQVWFGIMGMAAICLVLSFAIVDAPQKMTDHIELELEPEAVVGEKA